MNIIARKFEIEITFDELWNTAFDIRQAIYTRLKEHWVHHQSDWEHNEKERLNRCKTMFFALGRPDLYDDIFIKAKDIFTNFNKKVGN